MSFPGQLNKLLYTWWLKIAEIYSLTALKARMELLVVPPHATFQGC